MPTNLTLYSTVQEQAWYASPGVDCEQSNDIATKLRDLPCNWGSNGSVGF